MSDALTICPVFRGKELKKPVEDKDDMCKDSDEDQEVSF